MRLSNDILTLKDLVMLSESVVCMKQRLDSIIENSRYESDGDEKRTTAQYYYDEYSILHTKLLNIISNNFDEDLTHVKGVAVFPVATYRDGDKHGDE